MMLALEQVCRVTGVRRGELMTWVEERWVLPDRQNGEWHFTEADVARVRFIVELRRELRIDPETLPVVLSLLDRVYTLRRTLRDVRSALDSLPEDSRQMVESRLAELASESPGRPL